VPALRSLSAVSTVNLRAVVGETPAGVRVRSLLAAAQIALAVVLLSAGALLTRTIVTLLRADVGVDRNGAVISQLILTDTMSFSAGARHAC
jgi:hypothetical protein